VPGSLVTIERVLEGPNVTVPVKRGGVVVGSKQLPSTNITFQSWCSYTRATGSTVLESGSINALTQLERACKPTVGQTSQW
jgi:hypothetical protein